jgi:hypothetical protein
MYECFLNPTEWDNPSKNEKAVSFRMGRGRGAFRGIVNSRQTVEGAGAEKPTCPLYPGSFDNNTNTVAFYPDISISPA